MKNGPLQDVFPIENGDFPASHVSLPEGIQQVFHTKNLFMATPPDPCHHTTILVGFQVLAAQRIQAAQRGRQQRRQRAAVEVAARKPWGIFHGKFLRKISVGDFFHFFSKGSLRFMEFCVCM